MSIKKQAKLSKADKCRIAQEAAHAERLPILQQQIESRLRVDGEEWRRISEEHKTIILYRVSGGDTVKNVCRLLGIDPGPVYMLRQLDEDFAQQYDLAVRAGAAAIADDIREISRDETLSESSKAIELKALQWLASKHDRRTYGEQVQVQHNVTPHLQAPDWMGSIIEGQIVPQSSDELDASSDPSDTDEGDTDGIEGGE